MLGYIYSKITGKRSPRRGSQNEGDDLFFAGEDGHAERGDGHESHGRGDDIIGAGGGVLLIVGLGGVFGAVGDDDDAAARGEHRAGQVCPIFGIQRESLFIQLAAIDNQDSPVGDNIIFGSPGGQRPVLVSSLGSDAAGQPRIRISSQLI